MNRRIFGLLSVSLLTLLSATGRAQVGVYAAFSTARVNMADSDRTNGGTFGIYADSHTPVIHLGGDLRAVLARSSDRTKLTEGLIGPRLSVKLPILPVRPYLEGLVGAAQVQTGRGVTAYDSTGLAAGAAAGVDLTLLPHIDWRVVDYSYTRLLGPGADQHTISTGIVFRVPFL